MGGHGNDRYPPAEEPGLNFLNNVLIFPGADIFFLHNEICADDYVYARENERRHEYATSWSVYQDEVVPAFERLEQEGLIAAWGITAVSVPDMIVSAIGAQTPPQVVQAVANLLDSPGDLTRFDGPARTRDIIAAAKRQGAGVMGIRAVQAGALTKAFDRPSDPANPNTLDYARAAPFRDLCGKWGEDPAFVAHRYALGVAGVDTLVLGVKNRDELRTALAAEAAGPLEPEQLGAIEALGLRQTAN